MISTENKIAVTGLGFISGSIKHAVDTPEALYSLIKDTEIKDAEIKDAEINSFSDSHTILSPKSFLIPQSSIKAYDLDRIMFRGFADYLKFGFISAKNALKSSGILEKNPIPEHRRGLFVSTGINGQNVEGLFPGFEVSIKDDCLDLSLYASQGISQVHPKWILSALSNNLIYFLSSELSFKGDNNNVTNSALGGASMLDAAIDSIHQGTSDISMVSSADSPVNWQTVDDLEKSGFFGTSPNDQVKPSEAGATLILESPESVLKREGRVRAWIKNTCSYTSGYDLIDPDPQGSETYQVLTALFRDGLKSKTLIITSEPGLKKWDESQKSGVNRFIHEIVGNSSETRALISKMNLKKILGNSFSAAFIMDVISAIIILEKSEDYNQIAVICQGLGSMAGGVLLEKA